MKKCTMECPVKSDDTCCLECDKLKTCDLRCEYYIQARENKNNWCENEK